MESTDSDARRVKRRRLLRRLLIAVPAITFVALYAVYIFNNRIVAIDVPTAVVPSPNGYDDFTQAGRIAADSPAMATFDPFRSTRTVYKIERLRAYARGIAPIQAAVRRGLTHECLVPRRRRYEDLSRVNSAQLHEAARALAGAALYRAATGDWNGATDLRLDAMEMAARLPRGGIIADCMTACDCEQMAVYGFEAALPHLTRKQLAHVGRRLERIAIQRGKFSDMVLNESNFDMVARAEVLKDPDIKGSFGGICRGMAPSRRPVTFSVAMRAFAFMMSNKGAYVYANNDDYTVLADLARKAYRKPSHEHSTPGSNGRLISRGLDARTRYLTMETVELLLLTEVALERYHADDGRYPAELNALTGGYLDDILIDPFSGGRMRFLYKCADNDHYLLYSRGPDMHDDNGAPARELGGIPGDIVAGHLWPNNGIVIQ